VVLPLLLLEEEKCLLFLIEVPKIGGRLGGDAADWQVVVVILRLLLPIEFLLLELEKEMTQPQPVVHAASTAIPRRL